MGKDGGPLRHLPPPSKLTSVSIYGNPYELAEYRDVEVVERDVRAVERRLNVVIGGGLTFALAIMAIQVQILLIVSEIASKVG